MSRRAGAGVDHRVQNTYRQDKVTRLLHLLIKLGVVTEIRYTQNGLLSRSYEPINTLAFLLVDKHYKDPNNGR